MLALYGKDRLRQALVRKNGKLVPVPMKEALDLVAAKMKETIAQHGKDSVAMYGSGQWTIPDGYVASKFIKGCIGTNNLEGNARLCMSSAVTGFMTSFGMDEPMGCYDDIDHADVFVLWGNNMAEMHPVLFSRMLDHRLKKPHIKIIDLATRTTRTSMAADRSILFRPQADLAIANAICYEILKNGWHNQAFIERHCNFFKGKTNIGYGLNDKESFKDEPQKITLEDYRKLLDDYTPEKVEQISGVPAKEIRYLASLYGDPKRKVMSLWCMGFNQHTRGTWINNLVYSIHLLVGKIATPGNSPFSLTGQPSACGTVREVGTLTNRLPHGEVTNPESRKMAAEIWGVPVERIPDKPTYHTVEMFRALDRGDIRFLWIQVTNPMVTMPKLKRYRDGAKKEGRFVVVCDVYPTPTTEIADVVLPSAMWIEREGMFGNSERRTQHFQAMLQPPGRGHERWLADDRGCAADGLREAVPLEIRDPYPGDLARVFEISRRAKARVGSVRRTESRPGVMWPYVKGKETKWRYNAKYDPAAKGNGSGGDSFDFYGQARSSSTDLVPAVRAAPGDA